MNILLYFTFHHATLLLEPSWTQFMLDFLFIYYTSDDSILSNKAIITTGASRIEEMDRANNKKGKNNTTFCIYN